ncbi:hypothetical protein H9L13_05000 [Sphingomonas lutea]|uniref:Uncharacterized protein n=1 Tax=Sphingomonas lutea TaxID=1045317 RepID=A0A7G9SK60_9SPHN|nr:hypothetical protein [Sphingomonas lutea]QNN68235.1 hypothetical protein H9L13_05000 [Sphingomonas lutea]
MLQLIQRRVLFSEAAGVAIRLKAHRGKPKRTGNYSELPMKATDTELPKGRRKRGYVMLILLMTAQALQIEKMPSATYSSAKPDKELANCIAYKMSERGPSSPSIYEIDSAFIVRVTANQPHFTAHIQGGAVRVWGNALDGYGKGMRSAVESCL